MSHAYRVVWNEALNVWMAVAEISRRKGETKASVLLSGLLLGASPAGAVDETFIAYSGNWLDGGNWEDGTAPVTATDLQLNFDNTADSTFETTHDLGDLTLNKLSFVSPFPGSASINVRADDPANDRLVFDGDDAKIIISAPDGANIFRAYVDPELEFSTTVRVTNENPSSTDQVVLFGGLSGSGGLTVGNGVSLLLSKESAGLYSGDTIVELGGHLVNSSLAPNSLSNASRHIIDGTLRMAGSGAIGSLEGSGRVAMGSGESLAVGALDTDTIFSGVIEEITLDSLASLIKTGTGTLTLTGAHTYTGETRISNGTLSVRDGGSINHGGARLYVGDTASQTGTLAIGAGSSVTSDRSYVGFGGTGVVRVEGSGAQWQLTEDLIVGNSSEGTLELHDGGGVEVAREF